MNAHDTQRPAAPRSDDRPMTLSDFALYAVLVGIWGGSFIAIEFQLGVVANEVSILWRYLMAAIAMTGVCFIAKRRMSGFSLADHLHFVALGAFFFSFNYILIYRAQTELTSGLAAITFTMALFFTTLNARIFLGASLNPRIILGGVVGVAGLAVLFGDSILQVGVDAGTFVGLGCMLGSAYVVSLATIVTAKLNVRRVPALQANAWGMIYGAGFVMIYVLALGRELTFEWTFAYVASLAYLTFPAGVLAFIIYFSIVARIGPARSSYFTLMSPMVAIVLSVLIEGLPVTLALAGGVLAILAGNFIAMRASSA